MPTADDPQGYFSNAGPNAPATDAPQHDPQWIDFLAHHLTTKIFGPEPSAPVVPQQRGLSPLQAVAGASNPQLLPYLMQQANRNVNAQYQGQLEAFKQAMEGRRNATTALAALAGRDITGQYGVLGRQVTANAPKPPVIKEYVKPVGGESHRVRDIIDKETGATIRTDDLGPAPQGYTYQQDAQGNIVMLPSSGPPMGGGGAGEPTGIKHPPSAEQETYARSSSVLKDRIQRAKDLISNSNSWLNRVGQNIVSGDPTGTFSGSDYAADAATYKNLVTEIASLTRTLYGAQGLRSYQEIQNLIKTMPPWTAGQKRVKEAFDNLDGAVSRADTEMSQVRPDLFHSSSAGQSGEFSSHRAMTQQEFNSLKPSEQKRWIDGGGTVR